MAEKDRKDELRIEAILQSREMTKADLARLMGTTKENLNGKLKSPSFPTLVQIANALDISMRELFVDDNAKPDTGASITCPHCGKPIRIKAE